MKVIDLKLIDKFLLKNNLGFWVSWSIVDVKPKFLK